ncbi:MAG: glycosyltransferase family 39 protein [Planctomycetota bacterium]
MPLYFWGLWVWQQIFGNTELALRMTSVLAVASSAAVVCRSVHKHSHSVIGGLTAGLIIAVESNALFFGTELRPYAFVILVSSIAFDATITLLEPRERRLKQQLTLTACLIAGIALQPTCLGVLIWFPVILLGYQMIQRKSWIPQISLAIAVQTITLAAVMMWAWQQTLQTSWQLKDNWASFAIPTWIGPFWTVWSWPTLVFAPIIVAGISQWSTGRSLAGQSPTRRSVNGAFRIAIGLGIGCLLITFFYWSIAYLGLVPLWHRRYFIALLPVIASVSGYAISSVARPNGEHSEETETRPSWNQRQTIASMLAGVMVCSLAHRQGTLRRIPRLPQPLVTRGEDWRGAIEWLATQHVEGEPIYLDSGLIETSTSARSQFWADTVTNERRMQLEPLRREYSILPVEGPYKPSQDDAWAPVEPIDSSLLLPLQVVGSPSRYGNAGFGGGGEQPTSESEHRIWILSRRSSSAMKTSLKKSIRKTGPFDYYGVRVTGFGNVTVAEIPRLKKPVRKSWYIF